MKKGLLFLVSLLFPASVLAANYSLEIIQPQPSLTTANRYYKALTGQEYRVRIGVIGGLYPYTFSLTTYPSGMSIDSSTGIITWSNPIEAGSPHNITVSVTDSESTTATRSWTLTVSTSGFYFLDADDGLTVAGGGLGTQASPWKTLDDLLEAGTVSDNTIVYFMSGTYDITGLTQTLHGDHSSDGYGYSHDIGRTKPIIWLAYPNETPVIDFGSSGYADPAPYFGTEQTDIYIAGFTFNNSFNFAFWTGGACSRQVFAWNTFNDLRGGAGGSNSAFIMTAGTGVGERSYPYYHNNAFNRVWGVPGDDGGALVKWYSNDYGLIESNSWTNENGDNTTSKEGISLKAYNRYCVVRQNTVNNITDHSIGGSANQNSNNTFEFNLVLSVADGGDGVVVNEFNTEGQAYYYRNTFECRVKVDADSGDGPFDFEDNVIVNSDITYTGLWYSDVTDASKIVRDGDLTGTSASGIIDANGNLQGAYLQYLGSKGYQIQATRRSGGSPSGGSWSGQ